MVAELASNRMTPPISYTQLRQITKEACESTFESEESYEHSRAESWNTNIINTILHSLISSNPLYKYAVNSTIIQHRAPPPLQKTLPSTHNMSSTSTTIGANEATAHDETHPVTGGTGDERPGWSVEGPEGGVQGSGGSVQGVENGGGGGDGGGRRGMHCSTGAYWNTSVDGMWSYKYEAGEQKGFDVVIGVIWMGA